MYIDGRIHIYAQKFGRGGTATRLKLVDWLLEADARYRSDLNRGLFDIFGTGDERPVQAFQLGIGPRDFADDIMMWARNPAPAAVL